MTSDADDGGWPLRAACCYAALTPFQPVVPLPDGSVLRIAFAEPVAPLLLLAALVRPRRPIAPGLAVLAGGLAVTAVFSTLLALGERDATGYTLGKTAGLVYMIAVALAVARTLPPGAETRLLRALATGTFWSAVIGIAGFVAWLGGIPTSLMESDRLCATMPGDPNIFGGLAAVGLIIAAADRRPTRALRVVVLATALVLTASRSAFVGLAAGGATYGLLRSRDRWLALARGAVGGLAVALAVVLVLMTGPGQRVSEAGWDHVSRTFTIDSRFDLYDRAVEQFGEHPLLGLGVGGFHDTNAWGPGEDDHFAVHDTYLWALVDMGLAGGVLVVLFVGGAIARCVRAAADATLGATAAVVGSGLATMAAFDLFIDGFYQRHLWLLFACALALPLARRHSDATPAWAAVRWHEVAR